MGFCLTRKKNGLTIIIFNTALDVFLESKVELSCTELAHCVIGRLGLKLSLKSVEQMVSLALMDADDPQFVAEYLAYKAQGGTDLPQARRLSSTRRLEQAFTKAATVTDREIVARYEELAAAEDEPEIPRAESEQRQHNRMDFMEASARHRRVVCDAYAHESRPPSPGLTESQRQEMLDFVVTVNTAGVQFGLLSIWTIYGRPKNCPGWFIARRSTPANTSKIRTRDTVEGALDDLRETFRAAGMVLIGAGGADRPHVVETWLAR